VGFGGVKAESLLRVVGDGECFVVQREIAHHGVMQVLGAVGVSEDVVLRQPATEVLVAERQFADQFGELRVVGVAPGVQVQGGEGAAAGCLPIDVQLARTLPEPTRSESARSVNR
jgi:hypothetical protein